MTDNCLVNVDAMPWTVMVSKLPCSWGRENFDCEVCLLTQVMPFGPTYFPKHMGPPLGSLK